MGGGCFAPRSSAPLPRLRTLRGAAAALRPRASPRASPMQPPGHPGASPRIPPRSPRASPRSPRVRALGARCRALSVVLAPCGPEPPALSPVRFCPGSALPPVRRCPPHIPPPGPDSRCGGGSEERSLGAAVRDRRVKPPGARSPFSPRRCCPEQAPSSAASVVLVPSAPSTLPHVFGERTGL